MADQDFNVKIRTTAETSGAKETEQALSNIDKTTNRISGRILNFRAALSQFVGLFSGFAVVGRIKELTAEIEKINQTLADQGKQLVKNAQLYGPLAARAKDETDALKVSDAALKDIEATQNSLNELTAKQLGWYDKLGDALANINVSFNNNRILGKDVGNLEQNRLDSIAAAEALYNAAKQKGMDEVLATEKALSKTTEERIQEIYNLIAAEEKHKEVAKAGNEAADYVKAANAVSGLRKELEALLAIQQKETAVREKLRDKTQAFVESADPQVQAILKNEKAMFEARAAGRGRDADLFEKSALALRRGARPEQLAEVEKIYSSPEVVKALEKIDINTRTMVDLWK